MKRIFLSVATLIIPFLALIAQPEEGLPPIDKSPMDMSYYPNNYPILKIQDKVTEPLGARVIYGRPQKSGRTLFGAGGLVPYGQLWRMGANEATEIEFYEPVRIGAKKIPKGRYTMCAIVNEGSWTMILNKETDTWGAFKYDMKKDILRIDIPVQKNDEIVESLAMVFEKATSGFNLVIAWDLVRIVLPIYLIK